ncbi:metallophosphoesterase family protein [Roseivirga sp. BDSF3-8]|uniref:metallophosphoesterase family protein n=1 Tax=Roseivirga sp. BDSF3-8 TaxID=3241598 RepID=UPI0035325086
MASYVISDIHGCYRTFKKLCKDKLDLGSDDKLFVLGDHIDHGPKSRQVLDYFKVLEDRVDNLILLRGNHEQRLLRAYYGTSDEDKAKWLNSGGKRALKSFGVASVEEVPEEYIDMIDDMPYFHEHGDYMMVHAGFDFTSHKPYSQYAEMLEIRNWEYDKEIANGRTILHGHTPTRIKDIFRNVKADASVICLDNGCCKEGNGIGCLVALELESGKLYKQKCLDGS